MPRPPRIDYENAFHHVMNRGIARQLIFLQDSDRRLFLKYLEMACETSQIEVHCYCLMGNHFHLLVRSPAANLSKFLQSLSGRYTRHVNSQTGRDGPLFRGRANSILIEDEAQLVQTARYIHLNPVAAGLCRNPDSWPWSSSKSYSAPASRPAWLHVGTILGLFENLAPGGDYQTFLREGIDQNTQRRYNLLKWDDGNWEDR